jgi:hypothetical protein
MRAAWNGSARFAAVTSSSVRGRAAGAFARRLRTRDDALAFGLRAARLRRFATARLRAFLHRFAFANVCRPASVIRSAYGRRGAFARA